MNILITGATQLELTPIQQHLKTNKNISYFIHNVGVPLSLFYLHKHLLTHQYDMIIQGGLGGAFNPSYQLGDVCFVQQEYFADMGVFENPNFKTVFEMGFGDANQKPFKNACLYNPHYALFKHKNLLQYPWLNGITVQQISTDTTIINAFQKKYNAEIESMEGACLHLLCLDYNIPFLQIRTISNYVGDRNVNNWNIHQALKNLANTIQNVIDII